MILGIGTDLVINKRIKKLYERYGERFLNKILSVNEKIEFFNLKSSQKLKFLCSSFAAKEAVVKAFGVGFRGIYPSDISMQQNELGKPELINQKLENIKHHLSITNTDSYTLSFVVLEK
tara:strand:+ start:135 stop:491 length:357 start_codon:yes stop_codon:yes gene_type:complete